MIEHNLQPIAVAALGGAIKAAELKRAKDALEENSAELVSLTVELEVLVVKNFAEEPREGIEPTRVSLLTPDVLLAAMVELGIGPKRLAKAIDTITHGLNTAQAFENLNQAPKAAPLRAVLQKAAEQVSARLPLRRWSKPGRAATVRTDVKTLRLLEPAICKPV